MFLILMAISVSASSALAQGKRFGEGYCTTQGVGLCYAGYMDCSDDFSNQRPRSDTTTWDECLRRVKSGDPYRWLSKYDRCLGSDGRFAE